MRKTYLLVLTFSEDDDCRSIEAFIGPQLGPVVLVSACSFHWCLWFHWFSG